MAAFTANAQLRLGGDIGPRQQRSTAFLHDFAYRIEERALFGPCVPATVLPCMLDKAGGAIRAADVTGR
jgi:hypothetical protein